MRFDGTRPRTSHGSGRWRREDFAAWGEGTTVEETALVFRPEHVRLGSGVYVGHGAILHGARIGAETLVGMGATLLSGSEVGEQCLIAAGSLVTEGRRIPPRSVVMGVPAKVIREIRDEELTRTREISGPASTSEASTSPPAAPSASGPAAQPS